MMKSQFRDPELELNSSFNEYVTNVCHDYQKRLSADQRIFLKKCYRINVIAKRTFDYFDFKPLSNDVFRKRVERLSPLIELVYKSSIGFYKLRGIQMPDNVTRSPRGVYTKSIDPEFERMLSEVKTHPLRMHDIRLEARISELFENLIIHSKHEPHPQNWAFTIDIPTGRRFRVKVNVYRNNKMQVMVGCTHQPLGYDLGGFHELTALLGHVCYHLEAISKTEFQYTPIPEWKIKYLHLNRDGLEIHGKHFSYSITDLSNHSVFYLKKFKDGKLKPRFEKHEKPNKSIKELTKEM